MCALKFFFVTILMLAPLLCDANYTIGFDHFNGTNRPMVNTLPPPHSSSTHHTTHKTTHHTTHRTTTAKRTVRTTLAPIIVVSGINEAPPMLYQYSPIYKPKKNYKLNNVTKKRFDDFMRHHIQRIQLHAKNQKKPQHSASEYYFLVHSHWNRQHFKELATLYTIKFSACPDISTSSIICLPGSTSVCSPGGIIMCVSEYSKIFRCDPLSPDACVKSLLPCYAEDVSCLVHSQQSIEVQVPCLAVYSIANNTMHIYNQPIGMPVPANVSETIVCATTIVQPKVYRSAVRSVSLLGAVLGEAFIDIIEPTTLKPQRPAVPILP